MAQGRVLRTSQVPAISGGRAYCIVKRLMDVVVASILLTALLPVFVAVAAMIKLCSPGPVLYGGTRVGRYGVAFRMWKFRTMVPGADLLGSSVTTNEDPRITRIGRILRQTKLDELPNLWNVLIGDMTLVGPRPETPGWVKRYTPEMARILDTRPGITDVAQILFRHEEQMLIGAAVDEMQYVKVMHWKVALQAEYLRRRSLVVDLKVLRYTLGAVLDGKADTELNQLVAHSSACQDDSLPPLLKQRAETILGTLVRQRQGGRTPTSVQAHR
jgi:lipopolysaccharide/colanic/teichoic acid biosynthesis glycosyltransferase